MVIGLSLSFLFKRVQTAVKDGKKKEIVDEGSCTVLTLSFFVIVVSASLSFVVVVVAVVGVVEFFVCQSVGIALGS